MNYHHKNRNRSKNKTNAAIRETEKEVLETLETVDACPSDTDAEPCPATEPEKTVTVVGAVFAHSAKSYWFSPGIYTDLKKGDAVIVSTTRGMEMARIVTPPHPIKESDLISPLREVIRRATVDDIDRAERNRELEKEAAGIFKTKVAAHKLEMHLVSVEYTFDNAKLLFYFTAENRVDFRELVKDLASVFKTRIELVQIGIRDEAKMLGGLGACGRPFCCSTFLSDFAQVSIKMAKEQNFSLNSTKISGTCGRLMCCLRYEHEAYESAQKTTPGNGTIVRTPDGVGVVIETKPLAQVVRVRLDGENKDAPKYYPCQDVTVLGKNRDAIKADETGAAEIPTPPPAPGADRQERDNRPPKADDAAKPASETAREPQNDRPHGNKRSGRRRRPPRHKNNQPKSGG